jgi:hypothetical protein
MTFRGCSGDELCRVGGLRRELGGLGMVCHSENVLPMGISCRLGCNGQVCEGVVFRESALYPLFYVDLGFVLC